MKDFVSILFFKLYIFSERFLKMNPEMLPMFTSALLGLMSILNILVFIILGSLFFDLPAFSLLYLITGVISVCAFVLYFTMDNRYAKILLYVEDCELDKIRKLKIFSFIYFTVSLVSLVIFNWFYYYSID